MADSIAKWAAREGGPSADLATARAKQRVQSEAVLCAVGAVLLQRLKARPRTKDDTAIKARKRPAPGLPRRLRPAKKARFVLQREEQVGPSLVDLLHISGRARCTAERARQLVWQGLEPEIGLHHLAAAGPWPNAGTLQAKHGRLVWQWQCGRCQARASDSSRAVALLRRPCRGHHGVGLEKTPHAWVDTGAGPTCRRCKPGLQQRTGGGGGRAGLPGHGLHSAGCALAGRRSQPGEGAWEAAWFPQVVRSLPG
jgi:hypothetical protein